MSLQVQHVQCIYEESGTTLNVSNVEADGSSSLFQLTAQPQQKLLAVQTQNPPLLGNLVAGITANTGQEQTLVPIREGQTAPTPLGQLVTAVVPGTQNVVAIPNHDHSGVVASLGQLVSVQQGKTETVGQIVTLTSQQQHKLVSTQGTNLAQLVTRVANAGQSNGTLPVLVQTSTAARPPS